MENQKVSYIRKIVIGITSGNITCGRKRELILCYIHLLQQQQQQAVASL
jgi:hypothetical protein